MEGIWPYEIKLDLLRKETSGAGVAHNMDTPGATMQHTSHSPVPMPFSIEKAPTIYGGNGIPRERVFSVSDQIEKMTI